MKIGARGAESSVFDIEHRAPDRTRKTFSSPANVGGDSVMIVGNRSYDIDLKRSRVVTGENDALTTPRRFRPTTCCFAATTGSR